MPSKQVLVNANNLVSHEALTEGESLTVTCDVGSIDVEVHGYVRDSIVAPAGVTYDVDVRDNYKVVSTVDGTYATVSHRQKKH